LEQGFWKRSIDWLDGERCDLSASQAMI
jgi:hypothetical protein